MRAVRSRKRWSHLPAESADAPPSDRHRPKLTAEQVATIRAEYASGHWTQTALGEKYGVSHTVISNIVRGKDWKHVT